jgi:hypothetical protein
VDGNGDSGVPYSNAVTTGDPKPLRTTNGLERTNQEIRRRFKTIGSFVNEASCLRLASAILMEISDEWQFGKAYINIKEETPTIAYGETRETNLQTKCCTASPRRGATATWALKVAECVRRCRRAITVVLFIGIRPIVMTSQYTYRTVDLDGTSNDHRKPKNELFLVF